MTDTPKDNNTVVIGDASQSEAPARKSENLHNALPIGSRMGEFEIIGLVGEGGFGIVYLAQDHSLERQVALKEYMPSSLAARGPDSSVIVRSERHQETFEIGRRSFVNEARLLAQFDHPALVKVYRFWEANSTAYMAMPFYDGHTLRDALRDRPAPPDEAWLKRMLDPVTEALGIIHERSCFHRDIAPDNIMLLRDGRPVLLDFGAARRVISDMTQALTVILKPGYAPIEQYAEMPGMKQGPWTDIYALAAVVYFCIARKLPPPSVSRIVQDSYEPLVDIAEDRYSNTFLRGIDHCLAVKPENRPQSMAQMRELIGINLRPSALAPIESKASAQKTPELAQAPASPQQAPSVEAHASPGSARPSAPLSHPPATDPHVQDSPPASARRRLPLWTGMLVAVFALAAGGWFIAGQTRLTAQVPPTPLLPTTPETSAPAQLLSPAVEISAPPVVATPPAIETSVPAPEISATADSGVIRPAEESEPMPPSVQSAPPAPPRPATPRPAKPPTPKPIPAKPADQGDKAERDYMKQLNRDLEDMLR